MDLRARIRTWSDPWGYVVIYIAWAWIFWSAIIASGESVWAFPNVLWFYIGAISPALAGIVMIGRTAGRPGLRELWNRLLSPRRIRLRWYAIIVLLYPTLTVVAALIVSVVGANDTPLLDPGSTVQRLMNPLSLVAFLGFTLGAGLVEEAGTTGFFLDRLMTRYVPGTAGLISGVVWASWHIPLFFLDDYYGQASFDPIPWRFFATFVFLEIIYAWIYGHTARSVQATVLFHLMINLTGEVLAPSQQVRWYVFALTIVVAVTLLVWDRLRRNGASRQGQRPATSDPATDSRANTTASAAARRPPQGDAARQTPSWWRQPPHARVPRNGANEALHHVGLFSELHMLLASGRSTSVLPRVGRISARQGSACGAAPRSSRNTGPASR